MEVEIFFSADHKCHGVHFVALEFASEVRWRSMSEPATAGEFPWHSEARTFLLLEYLRAALVEIPLKRAEASFITVWFAWVDV